MPRIRAAGFLVAAALFVSGSWVIVSGALGQSRVARRADGLAAWEQVYSVLTHPRCINCHTATNYPQQGDDRHRHFANVVRGPGGQGRARPELRELPSGDRMPIAPASPAVTTGTSRRSR